MCTVSSSDMILLDYLFNGIIDILPPLAAENLDISWVGFIRNKSVTRKKSWSR